MSEQPVVKFGGYVPLSVEITVDSAPALRFFDRAFERAAAMRRYGWLPPHHDDNPFPRMLRLWRKK